MTMQTMVMPADRVAHRPLADRLLAHELRRAARRRQARAEQLRAWSREDGPVLARSLARRAAELELGATALELRAEGLEGRPLEEEEA